MWAGYKTKRWRHLRDSILRRDKWKCRESARYGVRADANTVHHVWPAEDYPEYAWAPWNLISLSQEKHEAMHDRLTGKLTPLGESWRRRISPPTSAKRDLLTLRTEGAPFSDGGETAGGGSRERTRDQTSRSA